MEKNTILPDFILPTRKNQSWDRSGSDHHDYCLDQLHFKNYPHSVTYNYNSRGFRDTEWPESHVELANSVWCIGDSFTVGIGSPLTHTWVNILQSRLGQRCINVSLDGASNAWIARKALQVLEVVQPRLMILHWSYVQRDESSDTALSDEQRRIKFSKINNINQLKLNGFELMQTVEAHKKQCNVIHSFVPGSNLLDQEHNHNIWTAIKDHSWPDLPRDLNEFNSLPSAILDELKTFNVYNVLSTYYHLAHNTTWLPEIVPLDLARDGHHYDAVTATNFVDQLEDLIFDLPQS
jgi:hypothetical protein